MTPKEKAKELVEKYLKSIIELAYAETKTKELAKQSALICVDEIIRTKPLEKDYEDHGHRGREVWCNDMTDYWLIVQQEISLL